VEVVAVVAGPGVLVEVVAVVEEGFVGALVVEGGLGRLSRLEELAGFAGFVGFVGFVGFAVVRREAALRQNP